MVCTSKDVKQQQQQQQDEIEIKAICYMVVFILF